MGAVPGVKYRAGAEDHLRRRGGVAAVQRGAAARGHDAGAVVARVRDEAAEELYAGLAGLPGPHQVISPENLVVMPEGARYADLERWRKGSAKPSGRNLERALNRAAEIGAVGVGALDLDAHVPHRRVVDLARYGMSARAQALRRHGTQRRLATLLATVA